MNQVRLKGPDPKEELMFRKAERIGVRRRRRTVGSIGPLVMALLMAASAQADEPRVTRGDAQAVLKAFPTGGWAIALHSEPMEGAPGDFRPGSRVRIAATAPWDGTRFCSLDWHVISQAAIEGNREGESRTNAEIRTFLSLITLDFTLDGAPLDMSRSAIARFLNPERFELVEAFFVHEGRVMAPDDLAVGQHTLQLTAQRPGHPPNVLPSITFFIDPPGEGACL